MLITTEHAGTLAQIVNRTHGKALGFAGRRGIDAARMCVGHTALSHQGGVAPSVLSTCVPDVAVAAPVHGGITLPAAARGERICYQGSGSGTGCRANGVVDLFILAAELEVLPSPGSTDAPYFFSLETYGSSGFIGVVAGIATEYIHPMPMKSA